MNENIWMAIYNIFGTVYGLTTLVAVSVILITYFKKQIIPGQVRQMKTSDLIPYIFWAVFPMLQFFLLALFWEEMGEKRKIKQQQTKNPHLGIISMTEEICKAFEKARYLSGSKYNPELGTYEPVYNGNFQFFKQDFHIIAKKVNSKLIEEEIKEIFLEHELPIAYVYSLIKEHKGLAFDFKSETFKKIDQIMTMLFEDIEKAEKIKTQELKKQEEIKKQKKRVENEEFLKEYVRKEEEKIEVRDKIKKRVDEELDLIVETRKLERQGR